MLELFTRHGAFDLTLKCEGDLDVDQHHTVEDVGIALGEAFDRALGEKRGILRAGYFVMPMDETLAVAAVDLSGRAAYAVDTKVRTRLVGDLQSELVTDFFEAFARGARANVHVKVLYGRSNHHKIEAVLQGVCASAARGVQPRQATGQDAALDQGTAVMRVTVIDYGAGNLTSVLKALRQLGASPEVTAGDLAPIERAERIVLPGVGHFAATRKLDELGITSAVRAAIAKGIPFLGICVGMQWLYCGLDGSGRDAGSGTFPGESVRVSPKVRKRCRMWGGTRLSRAAIRVCCAACAGESMSTLPIRIRRR